MENGGKAFGFFSRQLLLDLGAIFRIIASIATIIGISFASAQWNIARNKALLETSLVVLAPVRDKVVLDPLRRIFDASRSNNIRISKADSSDETSDLIVVLNAYNIIAIHYLRGTVDRCLVKEYSYTTMSELQIALKRKAIGTEYLANLEKAVVAMNALSCDDR